MDKLSETRINELCDSFQIVVTLSMLAIAENDVAGAVILNQSLKRIWNELEPYADKKEVGALEAYKKLLALEYSKLQSDDIDERIKIIKMSIDFDYEETLHSIALAKVFCEQDKYKEAIILADYIRSIDSTAPSRLVLAQVYRKLKIYSLSVAFYKEYLQLNENDKEIKQELAEVYKEMLEENLK